MYKYVMNLSVCRFSVFLLFFVLGSLEKSFVNSFQSILPKSIKSIIPCKNVLPITTDEIFSNSVRAKTSSPRRRSTLFSATLSDTVETETASNGDGVGAWFPLASVKSMTGLGPQRVKIMGIDVVLWHTEADEKKGEKMVWTAQVDACTHRLAPLSQGRVDPKTNCVECPYHGWQFDSGGTVTSIPQLESKKRIEVIRKEGGNVKTFPLHTVGDIIFVFLPASLHGEMFPQSLLPEHQYPHLSHDDTTQMFVRELPYSFDFLIENFMDPAHIPFAHHKLQSTRDDGLPIEMALLVSNFTHVELSFKDVSRKRHRDGYLSFQRPSYYHFGEYTGDGIDEATGKKSRKPSLKIYAVPISAGKSRIFLYGFQLKLPTALLHAMSNRFLNSDVWLHDTEREVVRRKEAGEGKRRLLGDMDYIAASQSDSGVSMFRSWWKNNGMADAPPHSFGMATVAQLGPTALSRGTQIDPWENHSKHCSVCRKSLRTLKRWQGALLFTALASTMLARRIPLLGLFGIGSSLFLRNFLRKFATVIEGNPEQSGIHDRSAAAAAD